MVYEELRKLARRKMAQESPDHTLQATALVHEAFIRMVEPQKDRVWDGRHHFFAAAAEAMRRILIEAARKKKSKQRGGDKQRFDLNEADLAELPLSDELLDLDSALGKLERSEARIAEVVKLRVFAGMSIDEVAECLGISVRTVKRDWTYARAWLGRELAAGA